MSTCYLNERGGKVYVSSEVTVPETCCWKRKKSIVLVGNPNTIRSLSGE